MPKYVFDEVCQAERCTKKAVFNSGLCLSHYEEMLNARLSDGHTLWAYRNNVYLVKFNNSAARFVYNSCGELVEDVCRCGKAYKHRVRGVRRLCPKCLLAWSREKKYKHWKTKLAPLTVAKQAVSNVPDSQNPNLRPYNHRGPPKRDLCFCAEPGCRNRFPVIYLEHKQWYQRYCKEHTRKLYGEKVRPGFNPRKAKHAEV